MFSVGGGGIGDGDSRLCIQPAMYTHLWSTPYLIMVYVCAWVSVLMKEHGAFGCEWV